MKNLNRILSLTFLFLIFGYSCKGPRKDVAPIAGEFLESYIEREVPADIPIYFRKKISVPFERCIMQHEGYLKKLGFNGREIENNLLDITQFIPQKRTLIAPDSIPSVTLYKSWKLFKKKYPNGYCEIGPPILNPSKSVMIIHTDYFCDERCGNGSVRLYKKRGNKWLLLKELCTWIT